MERLPAKTAVIIMQNACNMRLMQVIAASNSASNFNNKNWQDSTGQWQVYDWPLLVPTKRLA